MILARIVYDFDMKLSDESQKWIERQRAFALWDRSVPISNFHYFAIEIELIAGFKSTEFLSMYT